MDPTAPFGRNAAVSLLAPQTTAPTPAPVALQAAAFADALRIDPVSVADVLRNGFVYPPHSIFEGVDMQGLSANLAGRDPMRDAYRFRFRDSGKHRDAQATATPDWVARYHRRLCEAVEASCANVRAPWSLQSGGKDSTTLAIALADVRPDTTCITYLGGSEENEVASARNVATTLGLRHEALVCDPGRAYDRYLAVAPRMPSLTADFALLSYVDLAFEILANDGDGMIDGLGSDTYFGIPVNPQYKVLKWLARGIRLPRVTTELPWVGDNFELCFALGTLQMNAVERVFPGSRFTDAEVDEMFGRDVARHSRERLVPFLAEIRSATSPEEYRVLSLSIAAAAGGFAKGLYTAEATSLKIAYPFCDPHFCDWVYREMPAELQMDPVTHMSKVIVRQHIATRFQNLPYVAHKGSFRFDVRGLANARFDQVHAQALDARAMLPGAARWLERNRTRMDNKYHASKFYLLAVLLPWLVGRRGAAEGAA
jgi:asparagine synthetase B (glutamine-hydrolysing)